MKTTNPTEACYCQASRKNARQLSRIYDRHLTKEGISISQFSILSILEHTPDMLVTDLCDRMGMERTTLVRALKPLRDAGLIVSNKVGSGKALQLTLSQEGRCKVANTMPLWRNAQHDIEESFGLERSNKLRAELRALSEA